MASNIPETNDGGHHAARAAAAAASASGRRHPDHPYTVRPIDQQTMADAINDTTNTVGGDYLAEFDEDRAPSDFNIASGHTADYDDRDDRDDGCVMHCQLCSSARRAFHCRDCVRSGNFVRSPHSARHDDNRFADKRARYETLQQRHRDLSRRADALLEPQRQYETLRAHVAQTRRRLASMQQEVEARRHRLATAQKAQAELTASIADARKKFPQFENNIDHLRHFVGERLALNGRLDAEKAELQKRLQVRARRLVHGLVTYVFPVRQETTLAGGRSPSRKPAATSRTANVGHVSSAIVEAGGGGGGLATSDATVPEHVSALAEATRTAYVRGRWVLQDSQHELHHVVVAPSLPGNGDYSAYVHWIASNRDGVPGSSGGGVAAGGATGGGAGAAGASAPMATPTSAATASTALTAAASAPGTPGGGAADSMTSQNDAYRIAAALTYTTQMVTQMAFYLDVHLPFKINYGDFCNKELTAGQFQRKVARLNGNILALCDTQNVSARQLVATHTLANLLQLLNASELGRSGAVEVSNSLIADVAHLNAELLAGGDESDSDDENSFPHEWEAVPHLAAHETFVPMPASPAPSLLSSPSPASLLSMTTQTSSMAGGLVNGAFASVSSIWRGFTGR